jgi:hypothetical protein
MIRIELEVELSYGIDQRGADFVFNIHAAHTRRQIIAEHLTLSPSVNPKMHMDPVTGNRYMRLRAVPGELKLSYPAIVDLAHHCAEPAQLAEVPVIAFRPR